MVALCCAASNCDGLGLSGLVAMAMLCLGYVAFPGFNSRSGLQSPSVDICQSLGQFTCRDFDAATNLRGDKCA